METQGLQCVVASSASSEGNFKAAGEAEASLGV